MRSVRRTMAVVGALWVLGVLVGPVQAQWRWDPKTGWSEPTPPASVSEPAPPPFLPRYREAVEEAPVGTPGGWYYAAYLAYEADDFTGAAEMFREMAKAHSDNAAWAQRALFMRGECLYQAGDYYKAYQAFDEMLSAYPGGLNYRLALQREFEIAQMFLQGRRRSVLGVPLLRGPPTAVKIFERIREQDPNGPLADDCLAAQADHAFRRGRFEDAEFHYERLRRDWPQSPFGPQALYRTACGQFFRQHGARYDAGLLRRARAGFEEFLRRYPEAPEARQAEVYLGRVEARLAEAYLWNGRFYQKRRRPAAALIYYRRLLQEFPEATAAAEADRRILEITGSEILAPQPAGADTSGSAGSESPQGSGEAHETPE